MNLESNLERALQRVSPPAGFSSRVMQRIASEDALARSAPPARTRGWRAVAAGLLLTAIAGGWAAQRAIERREGERARDEVMLALRIAGSKVRTAQEHVRELGSH
jgi:hypothetical protein